MTSQATPRPLQLQLLLLHPARAVLSPAQQHELILALAELLLAAAAEHDPSSTPGGADDPHTHT